MKKYLFALLILICGSCNKNKKAVLKFINQPKEFSIKNGENIVVSYKFKNVGEDSLKIKSVDAACGCTIAQFSSNSFAPGEFGQIKVNFDSKLTKDTKINKAILVEANTEPLLQVLYLKGMVYE